MERSYYAIIPADVRYDQDLQPNAKLLFGEITALCNDKGYCWASNQYFAELYNASIPSVKRWINALVDKKYIYRKLIYKENSKEVEKRILSVHPGIKNEPRAVQKCTEPRFKNVPSPSIKNEPENITYINNTINNTTNIKKTTKKETIQSFVDNLEVSNELKEALVGFVEMRKQLKKPLTINAIKLSLKTLNKLAVDDETKTDIVNQSIEHSWLTFYPLKTNESKQEKTREEMGYAFLTPEETKKILQVLRVNYPMSFKNMTPEDTQEYLRLWSMSFKNYEYLIVATAVNEIIQSDTREFAPNVAIVKQQINKRYVCSTIEAGEAWQQVLSSCSCNPAKAKKNYESLSRNIQRALGGSYMLVDIGKSTDKNNGYLRDKFLIRYENIQNEEVKALSAGKLTQQEFIEHDRKPGALLQEGFHKLDFKGLLK